METAKALFSNGYNCAQAVFLPFAKQQGMDQVMATQVATAFGAGMGRCQNVCGAVTGALMALGLHRASGDVCDGKAKEEVYRLAREVQAKFIAEYGTVNCREIIGLDLQTDEGRKAFQSQGLHATICTRCVESASQIVQELLQGNQKGVPQ